MRWFDGAFRIFLPRNFRCNLEYQQLRSAPSRKWSSWSWPSSQWSSWQWAVLLCVVTVVSRLQILGNPIAGWDEDFYLAAARFMTQGAVPFVDFWDRKPIGIFLIYYPAALFPGWAGVFAYQAMGIASIIATGVLIQRFASSLGWAAGGGWAAIFYSLWSILLKGHDGQTPVFYNLLIVAAAYLIVKSIPLKADGFYRRLAAMLLCGVALQIKYSAIFESVYFGLFLVVAELAASARLQRLVVRSACYALAGVTPTLVVAAWYFSHGFGDQLIQANITANLLRGSDPLSMMARNFAVTSALVALPVAAGLWNVFRNGPWLQRPQAERFLEGWLGAAIAGFVFFPPWFDHYAIPLLMVACLAAAKWLDGMAYRPRMLFALAAVIALAGQALFYFRGLDQGNTKQLAQLAEAVGINAGNHDSGALFIYRAPHALYWLTHRPSPTRFLFNGTLSTARERPSLDIKQEDEISRIFSVEKPEVVVMRSPQTDRRKNEVVAVKNLVLLYLSSSYRLTSVVRLGKQDVLVYRRKR